MKKKYITLPIILIFAGFLGWQIYQRIHASQKRSIPRQEPSVAVEVTEVKKTTIRDVGVFTGTLLPKSQFIAAPKIAGRLEKIFVNIGDRVKHGQLIALLDDDEHVQQVEQARAELEVAAANVEEIRSALNLARREFDRAKALWAKKVVSVSELDVAESQYKSQEAKQKVALAQVAQKEALLKAAKVRLSYTRITASWQDGDESRVVGERFVDEGAMLKANDPIVSILDVRSLTAVFHVIERDYARVTKGQVAVITTDAFPNKTFTGTIARVAPLLTSLAKRNRQQGVFLANIQTKKAHFVPVTLGIVSGEWAEIVMPSLSGFVVTVGQPLLEDGSAITLPDKGSTASSSEEKDSNASRRPRSGENR